MSPKEIAKQLVDEFEAHEGQGVWTFLHRATVAEQMRQRIDNPNLVNQGGVGLCGPAAFLRDLIIDDPVLYAIVGRDLFERGTAHLVRGHGNHGGVFLEPDKDLRTYNIVTQVSDGAGHNVEKIILPEADWMVLGSIRQSCRHWFWEHHFYKAKPDEGGTGAPKIVDLFKDMGYSKVVSATGSNNEHQWYTANVAGQYVAAGYHVMMIIDANLLVPLMQYVSNEIPYHYVDLATALTGPPTALTFKIWTWGRELVSMPVPGTGANLPTDASGNLSQTAFLKYFYGFVAAKY